MSVLLPIFAVAAATIDRLEESTYQIYCLFRNTLGWMDDDE